MEDLRIYYHRGTPDCPIALYRNQFWSSSRPFTHWHTDVELLMVREGSLTVFADEQHYPLSPGDIILWEPGTIHGIHQYSPDVVWWQIIFHRDAISMPANHFFEQTFVAPLFDGKLRFPRLVLRGHPLYQPLTQIFDRIPESIMSKPDFKLQRFRLVMDACSLLLPWCTALTSQEQIQLPENSAVKKATIYIHNRLNHKLELSKIAKHVHLHPNYLCALFKKHMGETVFQHIARTRVEYAASLLRDEPLSVAQVVEKSGFSSNSLFFKKFKEYTGLSPLAYAKQHTLRSPVEPERSIP